MMINIGDDIPTPEAIAEVSQLMVHAKYAKHAKSKTTQLILLDSLLQEIVL
jgi:hypothetical protein